MSKAKQNGHGKEFEYEPAQVKVDVNQLEWPVYLVRMNKYQCGK